MLEAMLETTPTEPRTPKGTWKETRDVEGDTMEDIRRDAAGDIKMDVLRPQRTFQV